MDSSSVNAIMDTAARREQADVSKSNAKEEERDKIVFDDATNNAWEAFWCKLEKKGWTKKENEGEIRYFVPISSQDTDPGPLAPGIDYFDNVQDILETVIKNSNNDEERKSAETFLKEHFTVNTKPVAPNKKGKRARSQTATKEQSGSKKKARLSTQQQDSVGKSENSDASWKYESGSNFPKRSSELGDLHQVSTLPEAGSCFNDGDPGSKFYCDKIFDPDKCEQHPDVLKFLEKDVNPNKKEEALAIIHENKYILNQQVRDLVESIEPVDGSDWSEGEKRKFDAEVFRLRKDMREVSKIMGKSVRNCLGYYFGTFKKSDHYRLLKCVCSEERREKQEESALQGIDSCSICGEGGSLLICDGCDLEYHLACLRPRLEKVPEGYWECDQCVDQRLVDSRHYIIKHSGLYERYDRTRDKSKNEDTPESDADDEYIFRPSIASLDIIKQFAIDLNKILSSGRLPITSDEALGTK